MAFVEKSAAVTGVTVYIDNVLVARDCTVSTPEIAAMTADVQASGTYTVPLWPLLENMELAFTKIGTDLGLSKALKLGVVQPEIRYTQTQVGADGGTRTVLVKEFYRGVQTKIPGSDIEVGNPTENENTINVSRMQRFVDGVETLLVDRFKPQLRSNGVDYIDSKFAQL